MGNDDSRAWKDQYMLRLPDGMRDRIKAAAAENNRSMNAEIVDTLEEKYPKLDLDEKIRQLESQLRNLLTEMGNTKIHTDTNLSEFAARADELIPALEALRREKENAEGDR